MANLNRNESSTRTELIDTQLARAGWSKNRRTLVEEVLLQTADPSGTYGNEQFADYVLLGSDQIPLAVVEAKRSSRDELAGKRQAADYADAIKAKFGVDPFIFLTNGKEIQFWDRDRYPPRKIAGFYTRDDLERLKHQKRHSQYPKRSPSMSVLQAGTTRTRPSVALLKASIQPSAGSCLLWPPGQARPAQPSHWWTRCCVPDEYSVCCSWQTAVNSFVRRCRSLKRIFRMKDSLVLRMAKLRDHASSSPPSPA